MKGGKFLDTLTPPTNLPDTSAVGAWLSELVQTLQSQLDMVASGAAMLPYEYLTKRYLAESVPLGATASFQHETHGTLTGRFVKLGGPNDSGFARPVGYRSNSSQLYEVTSKISESSEQLFAGLDISAESEIGEFGWILIGGVSPISPALTGSVSHLAEVGWVVDDSLSVGAATSVGILVSDGANLAVLLNAQPLPVNDRTLIAAIDRLSTRLDQFRAELAGKASSSQINTLVESLVYRSITAVNQTVNLIQKQTQRIDGLLAEVEVEQTLQAMATFRLELAEALQNQDGVRQLIHVAAESAQNNKESARVWADASGVHATASAESAATAAVFGAESAASATASQGYAVESGLHAAEAESWSNLTASFVTSVSNSLSDAMPKTMNPDLYGWGLAGGPTTAQLSIPTQVPAWVAPDRSYIEVPSGYYEIGMRGVIPMQPGDVVRVTADVEVMASVGALTSSHFYIRVLDEDFNLLTSLTAIGSFQNLAVGARGVMTYDIGYQAGALADYNIVTAGAKYFRILLLVNRAESAVASQPGSVSRVHGFYFENATTQVLSESFAAVSESEAASATASAAAASASESVTAIYQANALAAAIASIPTTFENGITYFGGTNGATVPNNMTPNVHVTHGPNLSNTVNTTYGAVSPKTRRPTAAGQKWKIRARIGNGAGATPTAAVTLEVWDSAAGGTRLSQQISATFNISSTNPLWYEAVFTAANAGFAVPVGLVNYPTPYTSIQRIYALEMIDVDAAEAAAASAIAAASSSANASAAQAAAESFAYLSASLGQGALNDNSVFANWPNAPATPTGWVNGVTGTLTRGTGRISPYAPVFTAPAGQNSVWLYSNIGSITERRVSIGDWLAVEMDAELLSGSTTGAGAAVQERDSADVTRYSHYLPLPAGSSVGKIYTVRKVIQVTHADAFYLRFYAAGHLSTLGSVAAANSIKIHSAKIRYATEAEIRDQTVLVPMEATVSTHDSVIATHTTQLAARVVRVSAGPASAELEFYAQNSGGGAASSIGIKADRVTLGTMTSPVLSISSGRATVTADLYVTQGRVVVDTGTHIRVMGQGFGVGNALIDWFGPKMDISLCSTANAKYFMTKTGDAYYGGAIISGTLSNTTSTSGLSTTQSLILGPFGTNGNPIAVNVSWIYRSSLVVNYPATIAGRNSFDADAATYGATHQGGDYYSGGNTTTRPSSVVELERQIAPGVLTYVTQGATTVENRTFSGYRPITSGDPGDATQATIVQYVAVSFTYTDTAGGTGDRTFRAELSRGFSYGVGTVTQRIGITTSE